MTAYIKVPRDCVFFDVDFTNSFQKYRDACADYLRALDLVLAMAAETEVIDHD